ncbi:hypothetical protein [Flavivirga jejuensis]|uniref:Uncharacterized protein n=1 Tax=Flavivirga jejuensis TaxID=870487 RepID=A0ABT8WIH8_9FLAO|nr:hypothetical protein [Flavivirga jejuensis]MDO5972946.1 hypothetical protein [Flavivirga jejuensis]
MKTYKLEKWIWSHNDFEEMGWHDCPIYALKFDDKVSLDLDYIFKWNEPEVEGMPYTFWISPATLIFENVTLFKINFIMDFVNGLEIYEISKSTLDHSIEWIIETQQGTITIHSDSFQQIIRRKPTYQFNQYIPEEERGKEHFSNIPEKDYSESKVLVQKREAEFKQYVLAVKRSYLKKKMKNLNPESIDTKEFLLTKRNLNEKIEQLNKELNGTHFEKH